MTTNTIPSTYPPAFVDTFCPCALAHEDFDASLLIRIREAVGNAGADDTLKPEGDES